MVSLGTIDSLHSSAHFIWALGTCSSSIGSTVRSHLGESVTIQPAILVVDDEQLIRWSLCERLRAEGYLLCEAATGREALERFAEGVDLVLLDHKLPDIDGTEVLRRMQQADADTLVVMLTAFSTVEGAVKAMRDGAHHYVTKPFDMEQMVGPALSWEIRPLSVRSNVWSRRWQSALARRS
jgi:CheY-like chemotaxis protein